MNHCQITDKALLERVRKDDILVMAQPIFIDYDKKLNFFYKFFNLFHVFKNLHKKT